MKQTLKKDKDVLKKLQSVSLDVEQLIFEYSKSSLVSPEVFTKLDTSKQLHIVTMAITYDDYARDFIKVVNKKVI